MTEAAWLAATDPTPMLEFLRGKVSDRKMRLFAAACCRRKWKYFGDDRCRQAVEIAELFADDPNMVGDLDRAAQGTRLAMNEWRPKQGSRGMLVRVSAAAHALVQPRLHVVHIASQMLGLPVASARARSEEAQRQVCLLREIIGNLFHPVTIDSSWLTFDVVMIAKGAYEDRAFDRLPILADALQDAGCEDEDILTHLRGAGPHVRGCWALDLILGKS